MSDYKAWFNSHDLSELFVISPPERNLVTWEPTLVDSVIGAKPIGTRAQPMEITLKLTTLASTLEDRLAALRTLSGWLDVLEPKKLFLSDEMLGTGNCLFRYAMPKDTPKVTHTFDAAIVDVNFICPDPSAALDVYPPSPYSTSVGFQMSFSAATPYEGTAGGTAPADTVIEINGATGDSDGILEIVVSCFPDETSNNPMADYGGTITLNAPSSSSVHGIVIDSEKRQYTRNNFRLPYPPESDWIRIAGGHPVKIEVTKGTCGSGTRLKYSPRWW